MPARRTIPIAPSTVEDCLEALHALDATRGVIPVAAVAGWLGMTASLVVVVLEQLAGRGLAEGTVITGLRLTPAGRQEARRVVRRRRVLEVLMITEHGYSLDKAQVVVARLAYSISDEVVDRVAAVHGEPDLAAHAEPAPAWAVAMRARAAADAGDSHGTPDLADGVIAFGVPWAGPYPWPMRSPANGQWDA